MPRYQNSPGKFFSPARLVIALLVVLLLHLCQYQASDASVAQNALQGRLDSGGEGSGGGSSTPSPTSKEPYSLPNSGVRFGGKQMHRLTTKNLKRVSNKVYYFYGQLSVEEVKRHGKGFICSKINASKYIGGWCKDYRHGYGISFEKCQLWPGFRAIAHFWNMGIPVKQMRIPRSIVCIFIKMYRCPLTVKIMTNVFDTLPAPNCDEAIICDGEGEKPTQSTTQVPSERPSQGRLDAIRVGGVIPSSIFKEDVPRNYTAKFDSAVFASLRCQTPGSSFNAMIFSLTKGCNLHLRLKQSAQKDNMAGNQKPASPGESFTAAGNSGTYQNIDTNESRGTLPPGIAKMYTFKKDEDYMAEVGVPKNENNEKAVVFIHKKGSFVIAFPNTDKTIIGLLAGKTFTFLNRAEAKYEVKFEAHEAKLIVTSDSSRPIALYAPHQTPYYNKNEQVITIYFVGNNDFLALSIQHDPTKDNEAISFEIDPEYTGMAKNKKYWKAMAKTNALAPIFQCLNSA